MTGDNHFPLSNRCYSKAWGLVKMVVNVKDRHACIQTNEGPSGGAGAESMVKRKLGNAKGLGWSTITNV